MLCSCFPNPSLRIPMFLIHPFIQFPAVLLDSLHLNYFLGHTKPVFLQCLLWADHLYQELDFEHDPFNKFAAE